MSEKVISIVGGGIIGMMACLQLQKRGWQVTVFDRVQPGTPGQTSWGNAGSISIGNVTPLGKPGFLLDGMAKALSLNSPLLMPPAYMHKSIPWVLQVLQQSDHHAAEQISKEIGTLNSLSGEVWSGLLEELKLQSFVARNGWLKLYESEKSFQKTEAERRLMEDLGIPFQVMDRGEITEHDPAFSPIFSKAILQTGSLGINSPGRLMEHLSALAGQQGAEIVVENINSVTRSADGFALETDAGQHQTKSLLLASGAWSGEVAAQFGYDFPLETERGYHLFYERFVPLKGPSINMDRYVAMSPMEDGVRVTSCVELAGLKKDADYKRMHRLSKFAEKALPELKSCKTREWMGYRPSLPDSKPVIGKSDHQPGLYFAFGNGHLGMTQAAATGQLIAEIASREDTSIPVEPFSPYRFTHKRLHKA